MANMTYCPKCTFQYPANDTVGHCSGCHLTFSGMGAFDRHLAREYDLGNGVVHVSPESRQPGRELPGVWWIDSRGIWHLGERMSDEAKAKLRAT